MEQSTIESQKKIRELEPLADELARLKASGKKIVLSHGVFDLMHIGHLRHFSQAKKMGDILVVTLTPDCFVNKGPNKPAFSEALRAEAISALSCVDFVAVNRWPMATELIKLLKPDYYVKGSEYADSVRDVTGGIDIEREAIESVGGELKFTDDITFSSTTLINRHLSSYSKPVNDYLSEISQKYSFDQVQQYIDSLRALRVLVIGEAIIDSYAYCDVIGKSGKEPMLAIKQTSEEHFAGGILAVGNNVAPFVDSAGLITFIGDDDVHDGFIKSNLRENISATLLRREKSPTIVKKRFIESYFFTKLLSVYTINDAPLSEADDERLADLLNETVPQYDVVIIVDFGHSMMTKHAAEAICNNARFLAVNTQSNAANLGYQTIYKYPKADFVCITENELRLEARDRDSDVKEIIQEFASQFKSRRICITQGARGSLGFEESTGFVHTPALATKVVDRMGAGDTFMSLAALCAAKDIPLDVSQFIATAAAAQSVATVGHRESLVRVPLLKFIISLLK